MSSVAGPDPCGSGTLAWIRIRNCCSGYSKNEKMKEQIKKYFGSFVGLGSSCL